MRIGSLPLQDAARVPHFELVDDRAQAAERVGGVVRAGIGRAERRHHPVADELVERAVMAEHRFLELRMNLAEQRDHLMRRVPFGPAA